jgi:hypothetical protein
MTFELVVSVCRTIVEVALFGLLGQGAIRIFAGPTCSRNPIYLFFCVITRPPMIAIRFLMPALIIDKHIAIITFFVLFWLWIFLAYIKQVFAG